MKLQVFAAAACSFAATLPAVADAALVTNTYAIEASDFTRVAGISNSSSPISNVSAQFSISFDTTANSSGLLGTDLGLPAPYGTGLSYTYQSGLDRLNISQTPSPNRNDGPFTPGGVYFSVQGASTSSPSLRNITNGFFLVTNTTGDAQFNTGTASIRLVSAVTPAVPEPTTWAMMLVGFGMVAGATRYRRRGVEVSLA